MQYFLHRLLTSSFSWCHTDEVTLYRFAKMSLLLRYYAKSKLCSAEITQCENNAILSKFKYVAFRITVFGDNHGHSAVVFVAGTQCAAAASSRAPTRWPWTEACARSSWQRTLSQQPGAQGQFIVLTPSLPITHPHTCRHNTVTSGLGHFYHT